MWNLNIKLNIKQNIAKSKRITKHCILKHTSAISGLWIRLKPQPEQRLKILWYVLMSQCCQYPYVIDMLVALDHQNGIRKVYWDVRGSELTQNTRLSCVCDISCMKQIFVNQDTDPRRWDSMFWNIYPISFAFWPGHRISAIMLPHDQRSRCDQPYTSPLTYQMEACSFQWSCCTPMSPLVCLRHFVVPCFCHLPSFGTTKKAHHLP
jgi:hypothetical protein